MQSAASGSYAREVFFPLLIGSLASDRPNGPQQCR